MKFPILFFILTAFCFAAQETAVVHFENGDQLSGNAVALNLQTLTWQSELLKDQPQFKLDQIKDLQLPSKLDNSLAQDAGHEAVLELTNGNTVKGLLTGLNDKEIHLNTWYAGKMVFDRLKVKSINISRKNKTLYSGPNGIDDWKVIGDENCWTYSNNELVSDGSGSIARDIDFTDEIEIGYDFSWKGMLKSKLIIFTSDITTATPKSGYEISFESSLIRIRRLSDGRLLVGRSSPRREQPNENARITIRVSRQTKTIMVLIDDELQCTWNDGDMNDIKGKGLMFNSENNTQSKLSNIMISEWEGQLDEVASDEIDFQEQRFNLRFQRGVPVPPTKAQELPEGRMLLANGDTLEGEVLGIEGEMIKIKTPFTEVTFPVHRINNIALKKANLETPKLYQGDVRAVLADGSIFVFRLEDVKDGKIIGFSQNFGRADFLQSAFKRIEFNIYPKPKFK